MKLLCKIFNHKFEGYNLTFKDSNKVVEGTFCVRCIDDGEVVSEPKINYN